MFDLFGWFAAAQPAVQVSAVALLVSTLTGAAGIGGFITGIRSLRATRRQERRREPRLEVTYIHGSKGVLPPDDMEYRFVVNVANPTDAQNSIRGAELEIKYTVDARTVGLRIDADSTGRSSLKVPVTLAPGASKQGQLRFVMKRALLAGLNPEQFVVHLRDTYGAVTTIEAAHLVDESLTNA
ncbi:hypothetical protein [Microbacterium phyllosphaerae]|uniref:hypothetical protein n=1 Tax=Microbacterium phyllosphaerae TaxID=124798 RepID=UPI002168EBFD|nr:hypothetical protein [Microbacterium phyllosphaerae]MCS3442204.1 hypothetical protein [Microbacterium phyllosphaerae]